LGFAIFLMVTGVAIALIAGVAGGLWWVLIGFFIYSAAQSSLSDIEARRRLGGHAIREVMARRIETAPAEMTLDDFIHQRLYASHHGMYPVMDGDRLVGVVEPNDILGTPRERWGEATLEQVCRPLDQAASADPEDDAFAVLERMRRSGAVRMLVLDQGRLAGMVTLQDLLERLALEMKFEPASERR
jgi:CBS domain containing-hemolysin-like protein